MTTTQCTCTGCAVQQGTHQPAEALHQQIAEPQAEAMRLADECDESATHWVHEIDTRFKAAKMLRAQQARIAELEAQVQRAAEVERAAIMLRVKSRACAGALLVKDFQEIVNDRGQNTIAATQPAAQGMDAQDASILQYLLRNAKYREWDGGYRADFDISINADVNGVRADSAKEAVQNILAAQAKQGGAANG